MGRQERFDGHIAGIGTSAGYRIVVGRWVRSPYGAFTDVMVEDPDGHRLLLAPSAEVADLVSGTYTFDEVQLVPIASHVTGSVTGRATGHRTGEGAGTSWHVRAGALDLVLEIGGRTPVGRLVRLVPRVVATHPAWTLVTHPVARVVLPGVRTRGSAGGGRREYYGATDVRAITASRATWDGVDLGGLAPVDPPTTFGFSATPRRPSVTRVVTTIAFPECDLT